MNVGNPSGELLATKPVPNITPPKLAKLLEYHQQNPKSRLKYSLQQVLLVDQVEVVVETGNHGNKEVRKEVFNTREFCPPSEPNIRDETSTAFPDFKYYTTKINATPHINYNMAPPYSKDSVVFLGVTCTRRTYGRNELTPKELAAIEAKEKLKEVEETWNKSKIKIQDLKNNLRPKR